MSTNATAATNRYGALAAEIHDVTGFGQVGVVGDDARSRPIRPGAQSLTFEAVRI